MKIAGVISSFAFALVIASAGADIAPEPLFEGLGSHTISTNSPEAQKYFDQGFDFLFGLNHGAAIRAFQAAAKADPTCAMAHWGIALACVGVDASRPERVGVRQERASSCLSNRFISATWPL